MEDLFGKQELSRSDKMRKSRKQTTDFTKEVILYLNETGQFHVTRSNNIPSVRTEVVKKIVEAYNKDGEPIEIETFEVVRHFKRGVIKEAILDIQGFTLEWYGEPGGRHIEIEIKSAKDKLSDLQIERIDKLKKAGAIVFVASDMESLKYHIHPFLKEKPLAF